MRSLSLGNFVTRRTCEALHETSELTPSLTIWSKVDNKGFHYQDCEVLFHVNKQRADIAESLHVGKDDLDDGAQENHCLDKVVDVHFVKQRTVGFERQPRISRISVEVDVPVFPGRLAPCERVPKRRQHEQQHKPQQQSRERREERVKEK